MVVGPQVVFIVGLARVALVAYGAIEEIDGIGEGCVPLQWSGLVWHRHWGYLYGRHGAAGELRCESEAVGVGRERQRLHTGLIPGESTKSLIGGRVP